VDVRVDERRGQEAPLGVEDVVWARIRAGRGASIGTGRAGVARASRADRDDPTAVGADVDQRDIPARGRMDARVSDQQSRRSASSPSGILGRRYPGRAASRQMPIGVCSSVCPSGLSSKLRSSRRLRSFVSVLATHHAGLMSLMSQIAMS